jgi:hypothetical protein
VGSVARRFYSLEASPNNSFLERFPTLSKKKKKLREFLLLGIVSFDCLLPFSFLIISKVETLLTEKERYR